MRNSKNIAEQACHRSFRVGRSAQGDSKSKPEILSSKLLRVARDYSKN